MRRNALFTTASLLLVASLSGCGLFSKKSDVQVTASSSDLYTAPAYEEPPAEPDPYPAYSAPAPAERSYPTASTTTTMAAGGQYHTVAKKDTLFKLARMYYNDAARWKDIYEANRGEITDPDHIYVGQRLLIP